MTEAASLEAEMNRGRNLKLSFRTPAQWRSQGGGTLSKACHGFNQATGLVSPLRRQICLNPVCLGGLQSPVSLALSLRRSGSQRPALTAHTTGFRQIWEFRGGSKR